MTTAEQTWRYRVTGSSAHRIIYLAGEFDMLAADAVEATLIAAADDGPLVIDLAAVTFIDSCGIRALVAAANAAHRTGHTCTLAHVLGQPHRVLSLAGVLTAFR
jgi:anti-sigma B factor antagonist